MLSVVDKVVIVTGGSNGIGAEIVAQFLQAGAKYVAILDINKDAGISLENKLNKKHGERAKFIECDVTKDGDLKTAFDEVIVENGYIDLVVNNAGIGDERKYKSVIEINVTALVTSTLMSLELMRKDKGGRGGTIINISSIGALSLKCPTLFIYCATKAAVLQFTTAMGMKPYYDKTNVRMICVCFGITNTDIIPNLHSFDPEVTESIPKLVQSYCVAQSPEDAGKGVVEVYEKADSGSVWFIASSEPPKNITENIESAYGMMLGE
ncbi:15-hydroxyprostaglandin dehydrogenase [NAD(+)]-like [Zerene cesonia]|uniref:15-hydroxyprostaglandin dehydrogenase [NAD(+)]-like n=1 Tax=Zerene cesonia TaxID=33412 RepID=UPI0018E50ECB|nr:15-hydroxyprostaglandin dehydrogenase [NAD(+)]-like [Zerene cesonia]